MEYGLIGEKLPHSFSKEIPTVDKLRFSTIPLCIKKAAHASRLLMSIFRWKYGRLCGILK